MSKTVSTSKFSEWTGLDRISLIVHSMKCIWREISKDDFGLDGEIEIVVPKDSGEGYRTTGGIVKVQAKAGSSFVVQDSEQSFAARGITKSDLELWFNSNFPTIFVFYHPGEDKLYWKDVKAYIRNMRNVWQPPLKIAFDKTTDEFTDQSFPDLRELGGVNPPRVAFNARERLFSNLLRIQRMPPYVWSAPTGMRRPAQIWDAEEGFVPAFVLRSGRMYTFVDLSGHTLLANYCEPADVKRHSVADLQRDEIDGRTFVSLLNSTLNKHLRQIDIRFSAQFGRYYFPRKLLNDDDITEYKESWFNTITGKSASRATVGYYKYGHDEFWRHLAADMRFLQIGDTWYLQIIPKYLFTYDGVRPYDPEKVGPYTTKLKARQTNQHVRNHILFWSDAIAGFNSKAMTAKILVTPLTDERQAIIVERRPQFGIASFAIPDDPANYEEEEEQLETLSFLELLAQQDEDGDEY